LSFASSITVKATHGVRYAVCLYFVNTVLAVYFVVSKISGSARNLTVVPVLSLSQIIPNFSTETPLSNAIK
jgi:hypothetical protein